MTTTTLNYSPARAAAARLFDKLMRKQEPKSVMQQHIDNMPSESDFEIAAMRIDVLTPRSERPPAPYFSSPEEEKQKVEEFRRAFPFPSVEVLYTDDSYADWYRAMAGIWAERARKQTEEALVGDCDLRATVITCMNNWRLLMIENAKAYWSH